MNQQQTTNLIQPIFRWFIVFLWITGIFAFSAQPAVQSNGLSLKVTKIIVKTITYVVPINSDDRTINSLVEKYHGAVRKTAHGTIYFVLGMLLARTFIISGVRRKKVFIFALLFSLAFAAADEFHQLFVAGRGGQISDVLLDTSGAALGIGLYLLLRLSFCSL
jgi:VanZ family protein